mgnify:CR=1 FL=1
MGVLTLIVQAFSKVRFPVYLPGPHATGEPQTGFERGFAAAASFFQPVMLASDIGKFLGGGSYDT